MRYSECINMKPPGNIVFHSYPSSVLGDKPCWLHNSGAHSWLQNMILAINISKIKQPGLSEILGGWVALSHGVFLGMAGLDLGQPGTTPRESCHRRQGPSYAPSSSTRIMGRH